ncbi:DinB family protein [Saccharopolyspora sp. ID03-671]|uniref:DinB family protein n=1 Tax=Saccharopolyspora sp. ID03-671 TaxID=3073066 RepID=UPI003249280C
MELIDPPMVGGERESLRGFLDYQRVVLGRKCAELDDEQLRWRAVPSSGLTLLGLIRHMAEVERFWFRVTANAERTLPRVWAEEDFQVAFDVTDAAPAEAFEAWETEIALAREIERSASSLDVCALQPRWGREVSLRFVLMHVIEEYARHNGHADLIREAIDGATGD